MVDKTKTEVINFCNKIGKDPLLVQASGGNISWKENKYLWVKASGKSIAKAKKENIFVKVHYHEILKKIKNKDSIPNLRGVDKDSLRPSIETLMHIIMPQKIVLHLHPVEILKFLVRVDTEDIIKKKFKNDQFIIIDYIKPGELLAKQIYNFSKELENIKIIFLKNHGIIIGGETVFDVNKLLNDILLKCKTECIIKNPTKTKFKVIKSFQPILDLSINNLVLDNKLFSYLKSSWALYPDHIVFLGPQPFIYKDIYEMSEYFKNNKIIPDIIFIYKEGVYVSKNFNQYQLEQVKCYYEVLVRQEDKVILTTLNINEINDITNWESESYRREIN